MFGDSIGMYTGSLEFLQTDASLVGNNQLEVAIKRTVRMGDRPDGPGPRSGMWRLAIPNIHGVFAEDRGWVTSKGDDPGKRCSNYWWPFSEYIDGTGYSYPTTGKKLFFPEEFWFGVSLYLPGLGDEAVLRADSYAGESVGWPRPTNGTSYPLRTKSGSVISCTSLKDGGGEGFEVLTADGVSYRLDHMVSYPTRPLLKYVFMQNDSGTFRLQWVLNRAEYVLWVSSVRDRFGNTVTYDWDKTDPRKLNGIYSSDGRALEISYTNGQIVQVRAGDRVWNYTGNRIVYPDNSYWEFPSMELYANSYDEGSIPGKNSHCYTPGYPTTKHMHAVMRHPSGAVATFDAAPTLHGRSKTTAACDMSYEPSASTWQESSESYPATYYLWSLTSKSISGPGVDTPLTWRYAYSSPNGCYATTDPSGKNNCSASSPTTKWVDVTDPDGTQTRYTYGNVYNVNEGQLLSIRGPDRLIEQSYGPAGSATYPLAAGIEVAPPRSMATFGTRMMPLRQKTVTQDGTVFKWTVNAFDNMARPISVTKSNAAAP